MLNRRHFLQGAGLMAAASLVNWPAAQSEAAALPKRKGQIPGFFRMPFGEFEITAVYDGAVRAPSGIMHGLIQPDVDALLEDSFYDPKSKMPIMINAFLINTGRNLVLVDTGAGAYFGAMAGMLPESIKAAGYALKDIDTVLITHFHGDHVLGLTDAGGRAIFPKATVMTSAPESAYWLNDEMYAQAPEDKKPALTALRQAVAPYIVAKRLKTFALDQSPVPGIETVPLLGHTPGHCAFRVTSQGQGQGQSMVFWGDTVHCMAVQFPRPEVSVDFDTDQPKAVATRLALMARLAQEETWVAGAHLPFPGIGRLRARPQGYAWMPVEFREQYGA